LLQGRIILPNYILELRGPHARVLKLLEGSASFNRLMLSGVADEHGTIVRPHTLEELTSLLRADEARLVNNVQVPAARLAARFGKMPL
jgi:hypothetical protein